MNDFDYHAQPQGQINYADILIFFKKRALIIIICAIMGAVAALFYATSLDPQFTAQTQILIVPRNTQTLESKGDGSEAAIDPARVEGQITLLQSETITQAVIEKLELAKDPEFQASDPSLLDLGKDFVLEKISGKQEPVETSEEEDEFLKSRVAIAIFQSKLSVRRVGTSYAINIAFTSRDANRAALVANAVAGSYIQDQIITASNAAKKYSIWLEQRIDEVRKELNKAARAVQAFRAGQTIRGPLAALPKVRETGTAGPIPGLKRDKPVENSTGAVQADAETRVTLAELEARAQHFQKIYETYLDAFTRSLNMQSLQMSDARIITRATRPLAKSSPRTTLITALGGSVGILFGIGLAFIRHNMQNSIQSGRQLRERLGISCLAEVPKLGKQGRSEQRLRAVHMAPFSGFTGALKLARNAVLGGNNTKVRTIGVTSVLPGEGKTTIASNLAALIANSGKRVLLIDIDMHQAMLSRALTPKARVGVLEVLTDKETFQGAVIKSPDNGPDVLPFFANDHHSYSYEIFSSKSMTELLNLAKNNYDRIVIDMPPLGPVVDGLEISAQLDGVVMVAEWGRTPINLLEDSIRALRSGRARILGAIVTKVDPMLDRSWKKDWSQYYGNAGDRFKRYRSV